MQLQFFVQNPSQLFHIDGQGNSQGIPSEAQQQYIQTPVFQAKLELFKSCLSKGKNQLAQTHLEQLNSKLNALQNENHLALN